jgi:Uma2 family endonuclease
MRMVAPLYWTADMVRALPDDGQRYETVFGELLVSPSPGVTHQVILARLFAVLGEYVSREKLGVVLTSPADISWNRADVLVQPDLFVVSTEQLRSGNWKDVVHLRLAVEILSPSTARQDRFTKRQLYRKMGVEEYWLVDPEARAIEGRRPEAAGATPSGLRSPTTDLTWHPKGATTALRIELGALFAPV